MLVSPPGICNLCTKLLERSGQSKEVQTQNICWSSWGCFTITIALGPEAKMSFYRESWLVSRIEDRFNQSLCPPTEWNKTFKNIRIVLLLIVSYEWINNTDITKIYTFLIYQYLSYWSIATTIDKKVFCINIWYKYCCFCYTCTTTDR